MFGIGYQEMFVVLVVAMIIFGPSRLPELAGQVGRWVRDFRRMSADLTGDFEKTFAEVEEVKKSFKRELEGIQDEFEGGAKGARAGQKKAQGKLAAGAKKPNALNIGPKAAAAKSEAANGKQVESATATPPGAIAKNGAAGSLAAQLVATKADPLADVSLFDVDFIAFKSGANGTASGNGAVVVDDAISRVRRRRASAAYARRVSA
jgi:sec-independent protein translocase protein TatA